jgi:hydrogenase/urease accessory protein HupE
MRRFLMAVIAAASVVTPLASADEFKPAYLQVAAVEGGAGVYDVLWRVPALDENTTLRVAPEFPEGTRELAERSRYYASGAAVQRWRMQVEGGLEGREVRFDGLAAARLDVLVRYLRADGTEQLGRVTPFGNRFEFTASPGAFEVVRTYTMIGIEHILLGFDHLLFVLALVILVREWARVAITVTAFTVAHSITLAAATLGFVHVPGPPVEAAIALSIVLVAVEIVNVRRGRPSLAARWPWLVAFAFGLLHGFGFAGALSEIGLPQHAIPLALLFFNLGVEVGQLAFVAGVMILAWVVRWLTSRRFGPVRAQRAFARLDVTAAYVIGALAAYWVIERTSGF